MTTFGKANPGWRDAVALWVLPILFAIALFAMRRASLPFWQVFNLDPDYYYLLNGLRIVEGLSPTDVSHPGTPIQVLIAMVLRALHPLASRDAVVDAVLAAPEGHLTAATTVIYLLSVPCLWLMGHQAWRWGGLAPALLAQSAPFLARIIIKMALHPKPEPFMVISAALLTAVAFSILKEGKASDRHAWAAGAVMGFGIACKIHFLSLGLVPLFLMDRRRIALYALASVLAFALFFAPALGSLDIWLDWLKRVVLGSGAYGDGPRTVIDPGAYLYAIRHLFSQKWFYTGALAASAVLLAWRGRRHRSDPRLRLLAGLSAAALFTQVLIAKQPAPHYMVPALMLTGPLLSLLWSLSRDLLPERRWRWAWSLLGLALLASGINGSLRQGAELARWTRETQALPMERFAACAKVYFDAASAPSFAFQRGDMNAQARYSPKLAKLFPSDEYSWFIFDHTWWKQGLMQWNRPMDLGDVLRSRPCTVFRGSQLGRFEQMAMAAGLRFDDTCTLSEEKVYTLGVTCAGTPVKEKTP